MSRLNKMFSFLFRRKSNSSLNSNRSKSSPSKNGEQNKEKVSFELVNDEATKNEAQTSLSKETNYCESSQESFGTAVESTPSSSNKISPNILSNNSGGCSDSSCYSSDVDIHHTSSSNDNSSFNEPIWSKLENEECEPESSSINDSNQKTFITGEKNEEKFDTIINSQNINTSKTLVESIDGKSYESSKNLSSMKNISEQNGKPSLQSTVESSFLPSSSILVKNESIEYYKNLLIEKDHQIDLLKTNMKKITFDLDTKIMKNEDLSKQLKVLNDEKETSSSTMKRLEQQSENMRLRNVQLSQELNEKIELIKSNQREAKEEHKKNLELENKNQNLEKKLKEAQKELKDVIDEHEAIEIEREEEMRALQNTIDDSIKQRLKLEEKYENEFHILQNAFCNQEQQLLDDFEWKLHQIESACRERLHSKDLQVEEKVKEGKLAIEKEFYKERENLLEERRNVEAQMRQVAHYKAYEAELIQLRGLTHEQQRALRSAARQLEHFKFNEKLLNDEIKSSKLLLDKEKREMQLINQRRLDLQEENLIAKLDKQRNELNSMWENRLHLEYEKLAQENISLIEKIKLKKDDEIEGIKQIWDKEKTELKRNIKELEDVLEKEKIWAENEIHKITMENLELRKKLENVSFLREREEELQLKKEDPLEIDAKNGRNEFKGSALENQSSSKMKIDPSICNTNFLGVPTGGRGRPSNHMDSGCCEEESSEDEDVDEDDDVLDDDILHTVESTTLKDESSISNPLATGKNKNEEAVNQLREEIASLQGSIKKLTSDLSLDQECSSEAEEDDTDEGSETESEEEEDEDEDDSD